MFTKTLAIFIMLLLNQTNQAVMAAFNENITCIERIKVIVNMPDQILRGQPCQINIELKNVSDSTVLINQRLAVGYRKSLSRELYITIQNQDNSEDIGLQKVLYERNFASAADFIWLLPQQEIHTSFNLFDWYEIPSAGTYMLSVCYQADEELAYQPEGLCRGTFCSEPKKVTVLSE